MSSSSSNRSSPRNRSPPPLIHPEGNESKLLLLTKHCNHYMNKIEGHLKDIQTFQISLHTLHYSKAFSIFRQTEEEILNMESHVNDLLESLKEKRLKRGVLIMESINLDIQLKISQANFAHFSDELKETQEELEMEKPTVFL